MLKDLEEFRNESMTDSLTKIRNRRAYDLQIKKALEELAAGRLSTFSMIVFDVDHFKVFNNTYGHRAGDMVLHYVAKMTTTKLREHDFAARYGGDEFVIILPEAKLKDAREVAEKTRLAVAGVDFKIYKNRDVYRQGRVEYGRGRSAGRRHCRNRLRTGGRCLVRIQGKGPQPGQLPGRHSQEKVITNSVVFTPGHSQPQTTGRQAPISRTILGAVRPACALTLAAIVR